MNPNGRQNAGPHGRICTQAQPMFHRIIDAHPVAVRQTLGDIRTRFIDDVSADTLGRLELVLAEVLNNVTEHAGGAGFVPSVHLCIVRHDIGLACAITDNGATLPAECLLPRALPEAGDFPEGGFGWYLIQDLTQALCYYRESQRNFLAFTVPFNTSPAMLN